MIELWTLTQLWPLIELSTLTQPPTLMGGGTIVKMAQTDAQGHTTHPGNRAIHSLAPKTHNRRANGPNWPADWLVDPCW